MLIAYVLDAVPLVGKLACLPSSESFTSFSLGILLSEVVLLQEMTSVLKAAEPKSASHFFILPRIVGIVSSLPTRFTLEAASENVGVFSASIMANRCSQLVHQSGQVFVL